jgi:hypothetical protein
MRRLRTLGILAALPAAIALRAASLEIPAGSNLVVRTSEPIMATSADTRKVYGATIEQAVLDSSGRVAIPKGSQAQLVVQQYSAGGTLGSPEVTLGLNSVTVKGRRYTVKSGGVSGKSGTGQGIGKNRRTAEMTGGGAALGTILGAVAGGGKGAVIGAVAGAAAGGTAQVLTRGKEVKIPAETVVTFRLDQPLTLQQS